MKIYLEEDMPIWLEVFLSFMIVNAVISVFITSFYGGFYLKGFGMSVLYSIVLSILYLKLVTLLPLFADLLLPIPSVVIFGFLVTGVIKKSVKKEKEFYYIVRNR